MMNLEILNDEASLNSWLREMREYYWNFDPDIQVSSLPIYVSWKKTERNGQRYIEYTTSPVKDVQDYVKRMANEINLQDYISAVHGHGPKAAEWQDKPHQLIYELVAEIQRLQLSGN